MRDTESRPPFLSPNLQTFSGAQKSIPSLAARDVIQYMTSLFDVPARQAGGIDSGRGSLNVYNCKLRCFRQVTRFDVPAEKSKKIS